MNYPVYYQGSILPKSELKFSFLSPCFQYGLTPFDTIACIKGPTESSLFRPYEHIARLKHSCSCLDIIINQSENEILHDLISYLNAINPLTSVIVRIMAYIEEGSWASKSVYANLVFSTYTAENYNIGLTSSELCLATSTYGIRPEKSVHDFSVKVGANYLSARYATIDARKRGFDGALLLDSNFNLSELCGANIFFFKDNTLFTPQLSSNILNGITRDSLIKLAINSLGLKVFEEDIPVQDIPKFDFAFACGTTMLIKKISRIDETCFDSTHCDSQVFERLISTLRLLLTGSIESNPNWFYGI